jgi:hypothetical protein
MIAVADVVVVVHEVVGEEAVLVLYYWQEYLHLYRH